MQELGCQQWTNKPPVTISRKVADTGGDESNINNSMSAPPPNGVILDSNNVPWYPEYEPYLERIRRGKTNIVYMVADTCSLAIELPNVDGHLRRFRRVLLREANPLCYRLKQVQVASLAQRAHSCNEDQPLILGRSAVL